MGIYDDTTKKVTQPSTEKKKTLSGNVGYATNQFFGLLDSEPSDLTHQRTDNPPFDWPSNKTHYVDGLNTKTSQAIQRGYMRSLITDPHVDLDPRGLGAPNRRLFFQFNPQAINRSVSQTPGAMLPLLQSPEQLMQSVPGVSTFGFSLMFNRESEVNKGSTPNVDSVLLPSGAQSLVSQVGVLADILVLDTITGQGISSDMIKAVAQRQSDFLAQQMDEEKTSLKNLSAKDQLANKNFTKFKSSDFSAESLAKKFEVNIGNSAFLNPQPFRVMFSTLFMVEGIATNIDVNFTKFSQTMVPTQCTVTISMYALYIGFAKKNTFLYDNLLNTAKDTSVQITKDEEVINKLKKGLTTVNFYRTDFDTFRFEYGEGFSASVDANRTTEFAKAIEKKEIKDVKVRINLEYQFSLLPLVRGSNTSTSSAPTDEEYKASAISLTYKGSNDIPLEKITDAAERGLESSDFVNILLKEYKVSSNRKNYLSFRYSVELAGSGDTSVSVSAPLFYSEEKLNAQPFTGVTIYPQLIANQNPAPPPPK